MGPFVYLEPKSTEEVLSILTKYGEKVKVLAGGTDLVPLMREKSLKPQYVVNIGNLDSYKSINSDNKAGLCIGALTTIREIETSSILKTEYKMIPQAAAQLASIPIRNIATIGGNLCNASPAADMAPILMALSARVKLVSTAGERVVSLTDFFTGPADTVCKPDELMTEVQIAQLLPNTHGAYLKCSIKGGQELALVGVAVVITLDSGGKTCNDVKIALGSVAPTPIRAHKAEATIKGKALNNELIREAAQLASSEASPIDDIRGSAEYRKEMLKVFTRDALNQVADLAGLSV